MRLVMLSVVSGKARTGFFFEKKKQKTFVNWSTGIDTGAGLKIKTFFASFLFKKKQILFCPNLRFTSATDRTDATVLDRTARSEFGRAR